MPISAGIACSLSLATKALHKITLNKYNKCNKQCQKDQQTIESSDKLYRKSLQDNVIDENEYAFLCKIFTEFPKETKNEPSLWFWT